MFHNYQRNECMTDTIEFRSVLPEFDRSTDSNLLFWLRNSQNLLTAHFVTALPFSICAAILHVHRPSHTIPNLVLKQNVNNKQ